MCLRDMNSNELEMQLEKNHQWDLHGHRDIDQS